MPWGGRGACYNLDTFDEVAVSKKWYSFFVVTDGSDAVDGAVSETPGAALSLRKAADVAPAADVTLSTPAVASADLALVYESAQIVPPSHGYTVLKVAEMLQSEHIQALPADVKRKSVMVALDAAGVTVDEIVADAVRRDRALDTYERVLQKHADDLGASAAAENRAIEEEIAQRVAELRARIDENSRKAASEQAEFLAWCAREASGRGGDRRRGRILRLGESRDHDRPRQDGQRRRRCSLG